MIVPAKRETQFGLMWRRFRRHRLALVSLWIVIAFYLVAVLAEFLAPTDPSDSPKVNCKIMFDSNLLSLSRLVPKICHI